MPKAVQRRPDADDANEASQTRGEDRDTGDNRGADANDNENNDTTAPIAAAADAAAAFIEQAIKSSENQTKFQRQAIIEVLNMTKLNHTVFAAVRQRAIEIGWSGDEIEKLMQYHKKWEPTRELAQDYPVDEDIDVDDDEERRRLTITELKGQLARDIKRFINASRLGEVSIRSWHASDRENVIIIKLPSFDCPEVDYYRCELFNEFMPGKYITLFHNSLVSYHQESSYALDKDWCMGFNAHPSPYSFLFSGSSIRFTVNKLFEAVYDGVEFLGDNGPNLDCREKIPRLNVIIDDRIGSERFADLVSFCKRNNICDCIKYLLENEGKHALLPGLWLPWKALAVDDNLFRVFDEMLQDWEKKSTTDATVRQDGDNEEEEENVGMDEATEEETGKKKKSKKREYTNRYSNLYDMTNDENPFHELLEQYLNEDKGIMAMKKGDLPGALKVWESRGHNYAALDLISAIEFFLARTSYQRDVFEVSVMTRENMKKAGVQPLTIPTCNRYARMKLPTLLSQNFMIKPGQSSRPVTGMTAVVYLNDELEKGPLEVHRIILDEDLDRLDKMEDPERG